MISITGGLFRGKKISTYKARKVRYTSSKVRESIFNLIGDVSGLKVLELFAGSGIFSFEAISRGAVSCVLVENDAKMVALLRKNIELLKVKEKCLVLEMDVYRAIPFLYKKGDKYDIIFLDPPYEMGHVSESLKMLRKNPLYAGDSVIVVEHSKREIPELEEGKKMVTKRYGDTCVSLFWVRGEE